MLLSSVHCFLYLFSGEESLQFCSRFNSRSTGPVSLMLFAVLGDQSLQEKKGMVQTPVPRLDLD